MRIASSIVTVSLEMPSRVGLLEQATTVVGQLAEVAGLDEESRLDVQAAAHEALINAIVHGNRRDETRHVTLEIALERGDLAVRVRDEGQGFDPASVPDPLALENLCRPSGRGILLMKALMDAVAFRRTADGSMEVTMRKRLGRRPECAAPPNALEAVGV